MGKWTKAIRVMKYVLGFSLLVLTVTASACNDINKLFNGKDEDVNNAKSEMKEVGRYQIHVTPRETLLFDPSTGRTWILSNKKGEIKWTYVMGGADIDPLGILTEDERRQKMMKGLK